MSFFSRSVLCFFSVTFNCFYFLFFLSYRLEYLEDLGGLRGSGNRLVQRKQFFVSTVSRDKSSRIYNLHFSFELDFKKRKIFKQTIVFFLFFFFFTVLHNPFMYDTTNCLSYLLKLVILGNTPTSREQESSC